MSFSLNVFKQNGQQIIGTGFPMAVVGGSVTVNGAFVFITSTTNFFHYPASSIPGFQFPVFARLNVGDYICASNYGGVQGYVSNRSSLEFRVVRPANEWPDPTGYDVIVRNDAGQKEWFASGAVVTLLGAYRATAGFPGAVITVPGNAEWVAPLSNLPFIQITGANQGGARVQGVARVAANQWQWRAQGTGAAPAIPVGPFDVDFLLAI